MQDDWFVFAAGAAHGPYTAEQMQELLRRGLIGNRSAIARYGDQSWQLAGRIFIPGYDQSEPRKTEKDEARATENPKEETACGSTSDISDAGKAWVKRVDSFIVINDGENAKATRYKIGADWTGFFSILMLFGLPHYMRHQGRVGMLGTFSTVLFFVPITSIIAIFLAYRYGLKGDEPRARKALAAYKNKLARDKRK